MIQKPSPNFSQRNGYTPEKIVIHIMDGSLAGTDDWFSRTASGVSAHYGVGLKGEVHQYVQENLKAWHAGTVDNPTWNYRKGINPNEFTIGIEHEGHDLFKAPLIQLQTSASLIKEICDRWHIPLDRDHIVGHYQIRISKPNCPATDKSVIDEIIMLAKGSEKMVSIEVPQSKVDKVLAYLKTI